MGSAWRADDPSHRHAQVSLQTEKVTTGVPQANLSTLLFNVAFVMSKVGDDVKGMGQKLNVSSGIGKAVNIYLQCVFVAFIIHCLHTMI